MPLTSKTVLTRAQRRAIVRLMLRDPNATVWPDAALNVALDEALTYVQGRFPNLQQYVATTTTSTLYDLPAEAMQVHSVFVAFVPGGVAVSELMPIQVHALQGLALSATAYSVAATDTARTLHLATELDEGMSLIVFYYAAQQPWGTPTDVNTGRDIFAIDLAPNQLQDGMAELLLYAAARRAALRYAMQVLASGGGREFEKEYVAADGEFGQLMGSLGNLRPLRRSSGLF